MPSNEYHFLTLWRVRGTPQQVYELIHNPLDYPRWWPAVYLRATRIEAGDGRGMGRRIRFQTKGWLPYTLQWESYAAEVHAPHRLVIRATGDFAGRGIWTFEPEGEFLNVAFDWKLTADKPLLRYLSFLLKPVFSANHVWAMERGRESLELELARLRARTPEERSRIPAPPGPNRTSGLWLALGAAIVVGVVVVLGRFALR
jgi:uncharacterized protein YndB with AHSA1/START domain